MDLNDAENQLKQASEKKTQYENELQTQKNILDQNRLKHDAERKEAERYQAETEERFKIWQVEFNNQEKKLQSDFEREIQMTRKKIIEGE